MEWNPRGYIHKRMNIYLYFSFVFIYYCRLFSLVCRSNATLTVQKLFTIHRTTQISWRWCSAPTNATVSSSPANTWPRSPKKPSERRATNYRRDDTSTWSTTSAPTLRIHTNLVIQFNYYPVQLEKIRKSYCVSLMPCFFDASNSSVFYVHFWIVVIMDGPQ